MKPKEKALILLEDVFVGLEVKNHNLSKKIAIYIAHSHVWETLDLDKIVFWKEVVKEIEKL